MSKGIAIRTILLLLIGTIVAGIIIYLVYSLTRSPTLTASECQARVISWCTSCKNADWSSSSIPATLASECKNPLLGIGIDVTSTSTCATEKDDACKEVGVT